MALERSILLENLDGLFSNLQEAWVSNALDINLIIEFNAFLRENNLSRDAKNFAVEAIKALMEGGDVDFESKIIKDASFIGTDAECVLDELISTGNNIFKTVSEAFTNDSSYFQIRFSVVPLNTAAEAQTPLPEDNGIIDIKINANVANGNAIDLARIILHETIHAELHRIYITNNQGPNPLPQDLFDWYVDLWERYEGLATQNQTAGTSEHYYMAAYLVDNISQGLSQFDGYAQTLEHYKGFAWTGLHAFGTNAGYVTQQQLNDFTVLSDQIYTDGHTNSCDN